MAYQIKLARLKSLLYPFVTEEYAHLTIENIQAAIEKQDVFPQLHGKPEAQVLAQASRLAINPREHRVVLDFSQINQGLAPSIAEGHEYLASVFWRELNSQHALHYIWAEVENLDTKNEKLLETLLGVSVAEQKNHYWSQIQISRLAKISDVSLDEIDDYIDNPWDDEDYVIKQMQSWSAYSNEAQAIPAYWFDNAQFIERMLGEVPEMIKILPPHYLKNSHIINQIENHVQAYAYFWNDKHRALSYTDSVTSEQYEKALNNSELVLSLIVNHGFSDIMALKNEVLYRDEIIQAILNNYKADIHGNEGFKKPILRVHRFSDEKEFIHQMLEKSGFLNKQDNVDFFFKTMSVNLDFFTIHEEKHRYLIDALCTNEQSIIRNWQYLSRLPSLFVHISPEVLKDPQVVCHLIEVESNFYSGLPVEMRGHLDVIKKLVENEKTNMFVFYSMPSDPIFALDIEKTENKDLVKKIIKAHPDVLIRDNCPWTDNIELVSAAGFKALDFELPESVKSVLLNDKSLMLQAMNASHKYYVMLSSVMKEEWQITEKYLEKIVDYINHSSSSDASNHDNNRKMFEHIPVRLWLNLNFCQRAMKHGGGAATQLIRNNISPAMWQDTEFVLQTLKGMDENKVNFHYLTSLPQKVQQFLLGQKIKKGDYYDALYNHLQRIKMVKGINHAYPDENVNDISTSKMKI